MELRGKVVLVTGASRGLGVQIARRLAAEGAILVLAARDQDGLARVAAEVGAARTVACDVTLAADRERLVREASEVGPVEVLVNNAGVEVPLSVLDHRAEDVEQEVAVNLLAPIHLTKAVLPAMVSRGSGAIVMISSMSGKSPTPYNAVYTATKFGLNGFTASLRLELMGTGVHAGVVCPGFVSDAGMWADSGGKAPRMMREVSPDQVAEAVMRVLQGAAEILVTPSPVRPLLALNQLFPKLDGPVLSWLGVLDLLRTRAQAAAARRAPPAA